MVLLNRVELNHRGKLKNYMNFCGNQSSFFSTIPKISGAKWAVHCSETWPPAPAISYGVTRRWQIGLVRPVLFNQGLISGLLRFLVELKKLESHILLLVSVLHHLRLFLRLGLLDGILVWLNHAQFLPKVPLPRLFTLLLICLLR